MKTVWAAALAVFLFSGFLTGVRADAFLEAYSKEAVTVVKELLGAPLLTGGTDPSQGFDQSGFVLFVYESKLKIPIVNFTGGRPTVKTLVSTGKEVEEGDALAGDLVFFHSEEKVGSANMVGIYLGNNHFAYVSSSKRAVVESPLGPYFRKRLLCFRRYITLNA